MDGIGCDDQMRGHRKIAEQPLTLGNAGMPRGDHIAESPDRNDAEAVGRRKQLPVFQLVAEHGIGDVVGGERKAIDPDQQRAVGQLGRIGQPRLDQLALLQIVACDDEIGGVHFLRSRLFAAVIIAFADVCFATGNLFKTAFVFSGAPITPSRLLSAL